MTEQRVVVAEIDGCGHLTGSAHMASQREADEAWKEDGSVTTFGTWQAFEDALNAQGAEEYR